ncbi:MAG TPA: hypothetical protein VK939_12965 [Longimicrobiales bacterium]|nr:hypothetical protein [Longimicrobiales bacterium]
MVYYARIPLRILIPTVVVHLQTDEGDLRFRARWRDSPLQLQRLILHRMRNGRMLWFEDEWGHDVCIRPETVSAALVDGR